MTFQQLQALTGRFQNGRVTRKSVTDDGITQTGGYVGVEPDSNAPGAMLKAIAAQGTAFYSWKASDGQGGYLNKDVEGILVAARLWHVESQAECQKALEAIS